MIDKFIHSIFGEPSEKAVKEIKKIIPQIHAAEEQFADFSAEDIKKKTAEFQALFAELNIKNEADSQKISDTLESIKVEAFALVKTACKQLNGQTFTLESGKSLTWNMIPYDVQLVGGLAIHAGNISEMKTGEWKTLVATLPAYLNALTGNSVHIVTVNDYLAGRDAEEMGILYKALGLTVGVVHAGQQPADKQAAYQADVVYATNNELGFDYLRDNMVIKKEDKAQSPLFFAIIDEVDSILIDEARTPLIISMPDNEPTTKYMRFAQIAKKLKKWNDYKIDEKGKTASLTEEWISQIESLLKIDNIYVSAHYNDIHHIENALKASAAYEKDKDYLVQNGEVLIIDEHTGRVLAGRRYSEGLHQAIEAKEWVTVQQESKTLASITFQNYFRMYWKLSGMTGTAETEKEEFYKVYGLDTLVIPTNKPIIREDRPDLLFKNEKGKFSYVINLIQELHQTGQPILVGTVSVEKSEFLSQELKKLSIPHNVLNAKQHDSEAQTIAEAGQKWAITIATNMAGRWTDIKLGEGVVELWGLIVLGTEKHETRRIDNQLRGRSGRQWDAGMTQFLISPNDDIMRIFGWDKLFSVFNSPMFASLPDNEPLSQSNMLTKRVTGVQKQVEGHHFDSRKHILEYDDVINKHREIIYSKRNALLEIDSLWVSLHEDILEMIRSQESVLTESGVMTDAESGIAKIESLKTEAKSEDAFYELERRIMLQSIDELWMRHIGAMSGLREEVAFEGYAQRNPLVVYKEKAFVKFTDLMNELEIKVVHAIFSVQKIEQVENVAVSSKDMQDNSAEVSAGLENFSENKKSNPQSVANQNTNPLFVKQAPQFPKRWGDKSKRKKKIRV